MPILAALAFLLAARFARHEATAVEPAEARESAPHGEQPTVVDWAWRRPRQATGDRAEGLSEPPPLDLTVKPATPFAHPDPSTER